MSPNRDIFDILWPKNGLWIVITSVRIIKKAENAIKLAVWLTTYRYKYIRVCGACTCNTHSAVWYTFIDVFVGEPHLPTVRGRYHGYDVQYLRNARDVGERFWRWKETFALETVVTRPTRRVISRDQIFFSRTPSPHPLKKYTNKKIKIIIICGNKKKKNLLLMPPIHCFKYILPFINICEAQSVFIFICLFIESFVHALYD